MASETQLAETSMPPRKRTRQHKSTKGKKRAKKAFPGTGTKVKIDNKMKKLFRKRAREYNSDDDEDEPTAVDEVEVDASARSSGYEKVANGNSSGEEEERVQESEEEEDGILGYEGNAVHPGITRFGEGCRAFKMAFTKIIKHNVLDDTLGPVLSAHKKLVVEKLAEEVAERKVKGEAKKEKQMVGEKGHVKPANFLDSHEKFLISVATKGAVKLFNAVNKAQNAQKGLNPSRFKDAKELDKRRKRAFLLELRKKPSQVADNPAKDDDGPGWAPLRDSYMLTSSKLKNWDKMQDTNAADDMDGTISHDSSDED